MKAEQSRSAQAAIVMVVRSRRDLDCKTNGWGTHVNVSSDKETVKRVTFVLRQRLCDIEGGPRSNGGHESSIESSQERLVEPTRK